MIMKMRKQLLRTTVFTLLLVMVTLCGVLAASAAELRWEPTIGASSSEFSVSASGNLLTGTDADGSYIYNASNSKVGALSVIDTNNVLGTYNTFSIEGDFYFSAFPSGLRDNQYTPEERPLSFFCWWLKKGSSNTFNALRLDGEGYIHTAADGSGKTDVKLEKNKWHNIRLVVTPRNGICELFVDDVSRLVFSLGKFDPNIYTSNAIRFLDGYYKWNAKMRNLVIESDSDYEIDLPREASADFISFQTAKANGGKFDVRLLAGINGLSYDSFGYQVLVLNKDSSGKVVEKELTGSNTKAYSSVYGGGKSYGIKENFGYDYACLATLTGLDAASKYTELVVRPYVISVEGAKRYGEATILVYEGKTDSNGYPVLRVQEERVKTVVATDDTYIYKLTPDANYGSVDYMYVRNEGGNLYRAAYYKFTLSPQEVKELENAQYAILSLPFKIYESNSDRIVCDMLLNATGTAWTEETLTYNTRTTLAATGNRIHRHEGLVKGAFEVDILSYLKSQTKNADGSITVSFRLVNEENSKSLLTTWHTKESDFKPVIKITKTLYGNVLKLEKFGNEGYEPWGYAEELVDEWFNELRDEIYPKDEKGNLIYHEDVKVIGNGYGATTATGDYRVAVKWKQGTRWNTDASTNYQIAESAWSANKYARTLATLGTSKGKAFLSTDAGKKVSEYDVYGGISNAGFKGEATGFFHTQTINGRTYIIDPLGNPYFAAGMNTVDKGTTTNHSNYVKAKFETDQAYFDAMSASLKDMGINSVFATSNMQPLLDAPEEDRLAVVPWLVGVSSYMGTIGCSQVSEGKFPNNNTVAVFDPDFAKMMNEKNPEKILENGWADNPYVLAYIADNELPSGDDILTRYLTVDVEGDPVNAFSYAVAWTFLSRWMDTFLPSYSEYLASPDYAAMNSEFLAFVYARQYGVIRDSIELVDKNHMYIGSRVNGTCRTNEGYLRAAGYYLDIISTNLYDGLNPNADTIANLYRYSGKPFIVTEFFAKGVDAIDANGYLLANSTGAGILATTQEERGAYYEHYVMALLESKACVGWVWYRFRDNDQGIYQSTTNGSENPLIMLNVSYGTKAKANTFMDMVTGEILTAEQVGSYSTTYSGEGLASNQNVNKGIYNSNFSSVVMVYTYDASGKLLGSKGYEVQKPASENPASGTVLTSKDGSTTFKIGSAKDASGNTIKTVLTVYEGKYLALAQSFKNISDHIIGIVQYFDAQ
jgi:hypothetical protein